MTTPHWKKMVEIWFNFYKENKGFEPNFNPAAAKSLKQILKLLQAMSDKWDEDYAIAVFSKFLKLAYSDKWLSENFLLNVLYGKFDKIIAIGRSQKLGTSSSRIEALKNW